MKAGFLFVSLCAAAVWAQIAPDLALMSATLDSAGIAPDSLVTAFATNPHLTDRTERTFQAPYPTTLAGVTVDVTDSAGTKRAAGILYASPGQVNFLMPAGTAPGQATVSIAGPGGANVEGTTDVKTIAPALFSISGDGDDIGLAAAVGVRVSLATGQQAIVPIFDCDPSGGCAAIPLDVGVDTPLYLELFASGIRGRANLSDVTVTIGGQLVPVLYAGPQPQFPGLDQVNVGVPLTLRGAGLVNVVVTVAGQASNPVRVLMQ